MATNSHEVKAKMQEISEAWAELRRIAMMKNVKLAIAFIMLNIADAALTVEAVGKGGYELLPTSWVFWVFKIGMTLLFTFVLLILSDRYPRQIYRILIGLVVVMAGVCIFNGMGLWL